MGKIKKIGVLTSGGDAPGRVNASRLGHAAVEALIDDQKSVNGWNNERGDNPGTFPQSCQTS